MRCLRSALAFAVALSLMSPVASAQQAERRASGARSPDRVETYKTIGDVKLEMDIYLPPGHQASDRRPAIVFFFGGGWTNGTSKQFAHQAAYLASRGMVALAADYRVYSRQQAKVVDCIADAKSAIRWTRQNAARLGIDPDRIVSAGGSAGGHLAAAVGTIEQFDEPNEDAAISSRPNAMALFNPALNLRREAFPADANKKRRDDVGSRLGAEPDAVSPTLLLKAGAPPAIIFHGENDVTVPFAQAQEFAARMKAAGNHCELVGSPAKGHGFFNFGRDSANQGFSESLTELDRFLASLHYLQGEPQVADYIHHVASKPASR